MASRVPLDNVDHQHLRVRDDPGSEASANQALVVPQEFEALQREFPILFRKAPDGDFHAVALLGLDKGENLFLSAGRWSTRYVPATLRRGPFLLAVGNEEDGRVPSMVIDLDDERIGETAGEPIFKPKGGPGPYLQQAADALRTVHEGLETSRAMFALFSDLSLIAPIEIDVDLGNGTHYHLPDLFTVGAGAFAALSGEALDRLNRSGFLAAAVYVRSSLGNVQRLIELKTCRIAGASRG
jgi:SapC